MRHFARRSGWLSLEESCFEGRRYIAPGVIPHRRPQTIHRSGRISGISSVLDSLPVPHMLRRSSGRPEALTIFLISNFTASCCYLGSLTVERNSHMPQTQIQSAGAVPFPKLCFTHVRVARLRSGSTTRFVRSTLRSPP